MSENVSICCSATPWFCPYLTIPPLSTSHRLHHVSYRESNYLSHIRKEKKQLLFLALCVPPSQKKVLEWEVGSVVRQLLNAVVTTHEHCWLTYWPVTWALMGTTCVFLIVSVRIPSSPPPKTPTPTTHPPPTPSLPACAGVSVGARIHWAEPKSWATWNVCKTDLASWAVFISQGVLSPRTAGLHLCCGSWHFQWAAVG